jgi:NAD(P)-dependent dehydrogenase (short-subunit alcohol dehydrogenase family)
MPGQTAAMRPTPDHGEKSYKGSGRLAGKKAVITGADSGIGRAVAIAFAREGADVLVAYLNEDDDAKETSKWIEKAGRKAVLVKGDIQDASHCREIIDTAARDLGGIDILVNNAAHQATFKDLADISDEEWELTFRVNIHAMFYLTKAALPHLKSGGAIINTASINADSPNPTLLPYATTKGAIQNFTAGLAQLLASKGIRANAVAPGLLDPAHSLNHAPRSRRQVRLQRADEAARPAGGTRDRLRHVGRPAVELRIGGDDRRHGRKAIPLSSKWAAALPESTLLYCFQARVHRAIAH